MNVCKLLARFQFDNHFPFDQQIDACESNLFVFVEYWQFNLLRVTDTAQVELMAKRLFVNRLV